jgi:arsenical pump membrane protein
MLIASLVIVIASVLGMFAFLFFYPDIRTKHLDIQTFFLSSLIGAVAILIGRLVDYPDLGKSLISQDCINPLEILVLFLSMSFLSILLDEAGFFSYIAQKVASHAKHNQYVLFLLIYLLTSVLTIFTSNDIVILTFTPFILFFSKEAKINPLPYLVSEFVAANSWSMLLVIGNPTNIYLATSFGITFFDYLKAMALPSVLAGLASLGMMLLMFGHFLKVPFETTSAEPTLKDPFLAYVSLAILFLTIVAMAFSNFFDLPIWLVSLGGALVLILVTLFYGIRKKEAYRYLGHSLKRLPYPVIPFILSMFVLVMSLKYVGVISKLADLLAKTNPYLGVGLSSYLAANFLNNIPMSVLYTEIFRNMSSLTPTMIYLAIISSNLGAFLTPIGALAGVMWTGILRHYGMKFSIRDFFRYLSPVSLVSLGMAFLGLYL